MPAPRLFSFVLTTLIAAFSTVFAASRSPISSSSIPNAQIAARGLMTFPVRIWQAFAPPMMRLPDGWLEWCRREVFVTRHHIETASVNISKREQFTGFVGEVWLDAHRGDEAELCAWQALADLAAFCGMGHKITMGMGAVERIS
ncbi:MAG: CRISPR system precrRNA processing endoribonuclease RAMP protein Cas6 [Anaerolineae bacterium]